MKAIFNYLIFPGLIFSACMGLLAGWVDRKVTARLQWRVGPPWYQNFTDILKLWYKEVILPEGSGVTFLVAPYLGLLAAALASTLLGLSMQSTSASFIGDLIVLLYLLVIPALSLVIGASASRNPLASVGASREMKLILAYELPFLLSVITVIIKSGTVIELGAIIDYQASFGSHLKSFSGALAFIVALLCMQAKLCLAPFDISEAEQEIMGGALIEYSGLPLAIFKLTKAILLYLAPLLLITLFWAHGLSPLVLTVKFVAILVLIILLKNTNPRLRIDQALKFFWGPVTLVSIIALILAVSGK